MRSSLIGNSLKVLAATSIAISANSTVIQSNFSETFCDYRDNEKPVKTSTQKFLSTKESTVPLSRNFVANAASSISPAVVNISEIVTAISAKFVSSF